jgi:hypothetical protein
MPMSLMALSTRIIAVLTSILCKKRLKAEEKIVDLLINLRYYYDFWQRAKMFAWNLELISIQIGGGALAKNDGEVVEESNVDKFGDLKHFD